MPYIFEVFRTYLTDGVADGESQLITIALYGSSEAIDTADGASLRIIDQNDDGLISPDDFRDAVGGGGLGLDRGGDVLLFDGTPPRNDNTGTLYGPAPVAGGTDINSYVNALDKKFTPVPATAVETSNPDQTPGTDPTLSTPVCFTTGTLIRTPQGDRRVETLRPGDLVCTLDHGACPLLWVASSHVPPIALAQRPTLLPIRIAKGALGQGLPQRTLRLSPQHRLLIRSPIVRRMFATPEVLLAAHRLVGLPGITRCPPSRPVDYVHLLLERHEILFAEATPAESLFTGPQALEAIGPRARDAIHAILRDITGYATHSAPARAVIEGPRARRLAQRHLDNARPLLDAPPLP